MIPLRLSFGTGPQLTLILEPLTATAVTFSGGACGATKTDTPRQ